MRVSTAVSILVALSLVSGGQSFLLTQTTSGRRGLVDAGCPTRRATLLNTQHHKEEDGERESFFEGNRKRQYDIVFNSRNKKLPSRRQWLSSFSAAAASAGAAVLTTTVTTSVPQPAIAAIAPAKVLQQGAVCDASISVWQRQDALLYLMGTAHISEQSADLATELVDQVHPNAVFVELDLRRLGGGSSSKGNNNNSNTPVQPALAAPPDISPTRVILTPAYATEDGGDSTRLLASTEDGEMMPTKQSRLVIPRVPNVPISSDDNLFLSDSSSSSLSASTVLESSASGTTTTTAMSSSLSNDTNNNKPGLFSGLRQGILNAGAAAVGGAIRGMYQNLGKAGFQPGQEFVNAMAAGKAQGADIILGDRDVRVTLQRLTQALAVTDLDRLLNPNSEMEESMKELFGGDEPNPLAAGDNPEQFKREMTTYVEALKSRDRIKTIMGQLKQVAPELVQVMLTERDAYMAAGLDQLGGSEYPVITAVFGMAHQDGIEQNLRQKGWQQVAIPCQKQT